MMNDTFANEILALIFTNTDVADVGDAGGLQNSTTAGNLYVALHTADPGDTGNQTTSEADYTSYARVAVARSGAGWTVSGRTVENAATISFPQCTGGSNTITFWSVGTASSGTGKILYRGPVGPIASLLPFTGATNDNVTIPGNPFSVDDRIVFYSIPNSSLPTGITEGTVYWVKTSSGDVVTVSTTQGGGTLDITASGSGYAGEVSSLAVTTNVTPQFAAGALDFRV